MSRTPEQIVDAIIYDLSDRRGLDNEWDAIDSDIKAEIRQRWIDIVKSGRSDDSTEGKV